MKQYLRRFLIVSAAFLIGGCAATPASERASEFLDDSVITAKVKTALLQDEQVAGTAINVETYRGTVQLSGFAERAAERERATKLARAVPGVKTVWNDIRLK